jgi:SAM-dependent methyltransferase
MKFVKDVSQMFPAYFNKKRVLEIGSYDINGTIRDLFTDCDYTGLDLCEGKGVDVVESGSTYYSKNKFDTIISCEALEHDINWIDTIINSIRLLKPNGLYVFTCATKNREEHGTQRTNSAESLSSQIYPKYYKNIYVKEILEKIPFEYYFDPYVFKVLNDDLYFFGVRTSIAMYDGCL